MAQLVVAAAGAYVGSFMGPVGAQAGWVLGSMIGSTFGPTQKSQGPRLSDLSASTSTYGTPIPYITGSPRIPGQIVWASSKREIATTQRQGKGGGGGSETTTYTYEIDLLIVLTSNVINSVTRIWSNNGLVFNGSVKDNLWSRMTVYTGDSGQLPDSDYEAAVGAANALAYRGRGSVFIKSLQLGSGGQIPNLTFETIASEDAFIVNGVPSIVGTLYVNPFPALTKAFPFFQDSTTIISYWATWDNYYSNSTIARMSYNIATNTRTQLATFTGGLSHLVASGDGDTGVPYCINYAGIGGGGWIAAGSYVSNPIRVYVGTSTTPWLVNLNYNTQKFLSLSTFMTSGALYIASGGNTTGAGNGNVGIIPYGGTSMTTMTTISLPTFYYITSIMLMSDGLYVSASYNASEVSYIYRLDPGTLGVLETIVTTFSSIIYLIREGVDNLFIISNGQSVAQRVLYRIEDSREFTLFNNSIVPVGETLENITGVVSNGNTYLLRTTNATLTNSTNSVTYTYPTLQYVVSNVCRTTGLPDSQFDVTGLSGITDPVKGMAITSVSNARTILEMLASAYNFSAVLSDKIYFRSRIASTSATVTLDDLGYYSNGSQAPEPLPMTQLNELEVPSQIAVTYANIDSDYQSDTQYSDLLLTTAKTVSVMQLPLVFNSTEAKKIVDTILLDKAVAMLKTTITLSNSRGKIEPTDVILIDTGQKISVGSTTNFQYRMRVIKRADADGTIVLSCIRDNGDIFTQQGFTDGLSSTQTVINILPDTNLVLLDIPLLREEDNEAGVYMAAKAVSLPWPGCSIYESSDDITYEYIDSIGTNATIGTCTNTLGSWLEGYIFDEFNAVTVDIGYQELSSTTRSNLLIDNTINIALIGNEIIQFQNAELISTGVYKLTGLLRGLRGTSSIGHTSSEQFVLLSGGGVKFIPISIIELGRARYYKAVTSNKLLTNSISQNITPLANVLKPLTPLDARANRDSTDTIITWIRQSRFDNPFIGPLAVNIQLGETYEKYILEIYSSNSYITIIRTITTNSPMYIYTLANQVTDFGSSQLILYIKIYQISEAVGRGTPLISQI